MTKNEFKKEAKSYLLITLACIPYAVGFDWFFVPNGFTCGGFTGIAQIIHFYLPVLPVGMLTAVMNLPLFVLGWKKYGRGFLLRSLYAMLLSSAAIDLVAELYTFSPMDPMLACLYGGVIMGAGSGLIFLSDANTGGTELAAWLVKSRIEHIPIGNICLGLDLTVIILYAVIFRDLSNALYGGIALYLSTKVIDLMVYGRNTAKLAYIISGRTAEIESMLLSLDIGVTRLEGAKGSYTGEDRPVLLCAVRRREAVGVKRLVKELDPNAFFILCDASEVLGEGFGEYRKNSL